MVAPVPANCTACASTAGSSAATRGLAGVAVGGTGVDVAVACGLGSGDFWGPHAARMPVACAMFPTSAAMRRRASRRVMCRSTYSSTNSLMRYSLSSTFVPLVQDLLLSYVARGHLDVSAPLPGNGYFASCGASLF